MTPSAQMRFLVATLAMLLSVSAGAQELEAARPLDRLFTQEAYTEYALLDDPATASFRIMYMPLEREPGARTLINGTRHGSDGGDIAVWDPRSGEALDFEYIGGEEAMKRKLRGRFRPEDHYIVARLTRPVPVGGEGRVVIEKTYKDARTYYSDGPNKIIWVRGLSPMRFGVILPEGYRLDSVNIASQLSTLADGRLKLALTSPSGGRSPITIRASKSSIRLNQNREADQVFSDMKTLYDLDEPTTTRYRVEQTLSDARTGARARIDIADQLRLQNLRVIDLDTAAELKVTEEGNSKFATLAAPVLTERQSAHLAISGVVEGDGYRLEKDELIFTRALSGLRNTVWLPPGWEVSHISQPGTIGRFDGRVFVAFIHVFAADGLDVQIRAQRAKDTRQSPDR